MAALRRSVTEPAGSWTTVQDNIAGTGGTLQIADAGAATQPKRFFRFVLLP